VFLIGSAIASLVGGALRDARLALRETALLIIGHIRRYEDVIAGLLVASVIVVAVDPVQAPPTATADRSDGDHRQWPGDTGLTWQEPGPRSGHCRGFTPTDSHVQQPPFREQR
jgi:hypothetical protein